MISSQLVIDAWDFDIASILVTKLLDSDGWQDALREFAVELLNRTLSRNKRTIQYAEEWGDFEAIIEYNECKNKKIEQALSILNEESCPTSA